MFIRLLTVALVFFHGDVLGWEIKRDFEVSQTDIGMEAIGQKGFDGSASGSTYQSLVVTEGTVAAKLSIEEGKKAFGSWGGIINFPDKLVKDDEIWLRASIYIPADFSFETDTGSLKFIRLRQKKADGSHTGYLDNLIAMESKDYVLTLLKEGQNKLFRFGNRGQQDLPRGEWFDFEVYAYLDDIPTSQGGRAIVRAWLGNELLTENTSVQTITDATTEMLSAYFFTYWNGGAPKSQHLFMDNIIITNEKPNNRDKFGNPTIGSNLNPAMSPGVFTGKVIR